MGAAWRDLAGRKSGFEKILKMVTEVRGMGMEGESLLVIGRWC
jgi:biotin synthase